MLLSCSCLLALALPPPRPISLFLCSFLLSCRRDKRGEVGLGEVGLEEILVCDVRMPESAVLVKYGVFVPGSSFQDWARGNEAWESSLSISGARMIR